MSTHPNRIAQPSHTGPSRAGAVAPAVEEFLHRVHRLWRSHRPVSSSLWGPPVWERAEDLSDEGLTAWQDTLTALRVEVARLANGSVSTLEQVILAELRRFLEEQHVRDVHQDLYRSSAAAYLQLCAFALLPFTLAPRKSEGQEGAWSELALSRIAMCDCWLTVAEQRLKRGEIASTPQSQALATEVARAIERTEYLPLLARQGLARRLDRWSQLPLMRARRPGKGFSLRAYLRDVLGVEQELESVHEALRAFLQHEVVAFSTRPVSAPARPPPEVAALNLHLARDRHHWMRHVELLLREHARKHTLTELGPKPDIRSLPTVLTPFLHDGVYIPPTTAGLGVSPGGWLLEHTLPASTSGFALAPAEVRAYLALLVAHEVCPGHAEQLRRATGSPLAVLYEITRSPVGLEGWAMHAEQSLAMLDDVIPEAARTVSLHRLRRLLGATRVLQEMVGGRGAADVEMRHVLQQLPDQVARRLAALLPSTNLSLLNYAVGALETEQALQTIARRLQTRATAPAAVESLLAWGPAAPRHVLQLIAAQQCQKPSAPQTMP